MIRKGATSGLIDLDQIRIGETWDAVVIPEPSTYTALIGLLALGLVAWRRRR
ncbi:MAG: PEP-CTERM sorting domain-containing protein [Opitutales bacterium]|nr:PEP-CTERM sorting domain-containing protein [Opitutales bacterium]